MTRNAPERVLGALSKPDLDAEFRSTTNDSVAGFRGKCHRHRPQASKNNASGSSPS